MTIQLVTKLQAKTIGVTSLPSNQPVHIYSGSYTINIHQLVHLTSGGRSDSIQRARQPPQQMLRRALRLLPWKPPRGGARKGGAVRIDRPGLLGQGWKRGDPRMALVGRFRLVDVGENW